jgi:hypothetical protein
MEVIQSRHTIRRVVVYTRGYLLMKSFFSSCFKQKLRRTMDEIRPKISLEEIRNWHVKPATPSNEAVTAV